MAEIMGIGDSVCTMPQRLPAQLHLFGSVAIQSDGSRPRKTSLYSSERRKASRSLLSKKSTRLKPSGVSVRWADGPGDISFGSFSPGMDASVDSVLVPIDVR